MVGSFLRHSVNSTKTAPCVEVWQTSTLRPLRLGKEKKKKEEEETTGPKYNGRICYAAWSCGLFLTNRSPAKAAQTIMVLMPFWVLTLVGPRSRNHCVRWSPDTVM